MKRRLVVGLSVATLLLPILSLTAFGAAGPRIYVPMGLTGQKSYPAPSPRPSSQPQPSPSASPRPSPSASARPSPSASARPSPSASPSARPSPSAPAPVPTTPSTPPAVGKCGESQDTWHPPLINGCAAGHEHGDAPPQWIADAGYQVRFTFHGNTSPAENTTKHAAMKGFSTRFNNQDVYFRIHAASNPLDRMARYHSYELWIRDTSGAVSHLQGWYNTGDPRPASQGGSRFVRRRGVEPQQRPIMLIPDETSASQGINCEQWYAAPGQPIWGPDFGWTICNTTTLYRENENANAYQQSSWVTTGDLGTTRRLELAWYGNRSNLRGRFVTDQFGEQVNSCVEGRDVVKFGETYKTVCLEQVLAPTLQTIQFPNNAVQKDFPDDGVQVPN